MPKYMVETVSMFRLRYVVEAKDPTHAADEVIMGLDRDAPELKEFSQHHIDELVNSVRRITDAEYIRIFDEDNDYLSSWSEEEKFKLINVINYDKT